MEYKKEQIAKEQEAKKKAEQDAKDRQPGHCTILNSAGGGTFSLLETSIETKTNAKKVNLRRSTSKRVLLTNRQHIAFWDMVKGPLMNFGQQAIGGLLNNPSNDPQYKQQILACIALKNSTTFN